MLEANKHTTARLTSMGNEDLRRQKTRKHIALSPDWAKIRNCQCSECRAISISHMADGKWDVVINFEIAWQFLKTWLTPLLP